MTQQKGNRSILLMMFPIVVVTMILIWRNAITPPIENPSADNPTIDAEYRAASIRALAAAESSNFEVALDLWHDLFEMYPNDQSAKFNYVVTAVAYIQDASQLISFRPLRPKEIEKLRTSLEATQAIANRHMADLKADAFQRSKLAFLDSQLYQASARLEKSREESEKCYQEAANAIISAIASDPSSALLAGELDELVGYLSDDEELNRNATEALFHAWNDQPHNLFLTYRCGERLLQAKDTRLAHVARLLVIARLRPNLVGL